MTTTPFGVETGLGLSKVSQNAIINPIITQSVRFQEQILQLKMTSNSQLFTLPATFYGITKLRVLTIRYKTATTNMQVLHLKITNFESKTFFNPVGAVQFPYTIQMMLVPFADTIINYDAPLTTPDFISDTPVNIASLQLDVFYK